MIATNSKEIDRVLFWLRCFEGYPQYPKGPEADLVLRTRAGIIAGIVRDSPVTMEAGEVNDLDWTMNKLLADCDHFPLPSEFKELYLAYFPPKE